MRTRRGAYDAANRTISVTFTHADVRHTRPVPVVLTADGELDEPATRARIEDVARGVQVKIEAGVITNPPAVSAPRG